MCQQREQMTALWNCVMSLSPAKPLIHTETHKDIQTHTHTHTHAHTHTHTHTPLEHNSTPLNKIERTEGLRLLMSDKLYLKSGEVCVPIYVYECERECLCALVCVSGCA